MGDLHPYEDIEEFKKRLIDSTLFIGTCFGLLAFVVGYLPMSEDRRDFNFYTDLVCIITLFGVSVFRKKLSKEIKALVVIATLMVFIVTDSWDWGVFALNSVLIIIIPFYALLVFRFWQTVVMFVVAVAGFLIASIPQTFELTDRLPPLLDRMHSWPFLVTHALILSIVAIVIVMFSKRYNTMLANLIKDLDKKNADLLEREKSLEMERSFANSVLDSMPGIFNLFKKTENGYELVRWNKNTEKMSGLSKEELPGQNPLFVVHPDFHDKISHVVQNINNNVHDSATALTQHHSNEKISKWHYFSGLPVKFGEEEYFIGTALDISDQKETEKLFKEEKAFSLRLLNIIPGVFYLFEKHDDSYQLRRWNHNLEKQTGYSPDELIHMRPRDFFTDEHQRSIGETFEQATENKSISIEAPIKRKNDTSDYWYFVNKKFSENGKEYILGVGIDISDRKIMERELEHRNYNLKDMLGDLQSRNKQLAEYAFINSHLLRAPLARILGLAELVTKRVILSEHKELLENFKVSAHELDTIVSKINDVLDKRKDLDREDILRELSELNLRTRANIDDDDTNPVVDKK